MIEKTYSARLLKFEDEYRNELFCEGKMKTGKELLDPLLINYIDYINCMLNKYKAELTTSSPATVPLFSKET